MPRCSSVDRSFYLASVESYAAPFATAASETFLIEAVIFSSLFFSYLCLSLSLSLCPFLSPFEWQCLMENFNEHPPYPC